MSPPSSASGLGLPHITDVTAFDVESDTSVRVKKNVGGAVSEYRVRLPAVIGVDRKLNKVRHPSVMGIFGAKKKPLITLSWPLILLTWTRVGWGCRFAHPGGRLPDVQYDESA
jgi:electron transfer flavoprotein alpha/beta subunit